jgi:glucose-6-phosphate 1-dehydrogenase
VAGSAGSHLAFASVPHSAPSGIAPFAADDVRRYRPAEPILFVIFGATGDLSRRKLLPSLYNLAVQELLPERFTLVGAAREELSREQFQALAETAIREHSRLQPVDDGILWRLLHLLDYESVDLYDEVAFAG